MNLPHLRLIFTIRHSLSSGYSGAKVQGPRPVHYRSPKRFGTLKTRRDGAIAVLADKVKTGEPQAAEIFRRLADADRLPAETQ